ncbi:hypothetical protein [Virgibacillus sp. L01]|uniref:hypothetical protein n=1 Tax=Virgibacillus sp. L01 TaxID=3457429 RepID=UPI003FD68F2F
MESYTYTKDLINNSDEHLTNEDEIDLEQIKLFKEEFGSMPDIEMDVNSITDEQREEFKQLIKEANKEAAKGKEADDGFIGKISGSVSLFVAIPQVPGAIEKYYVVIKFLYTLVT